MSDATPTMALAVDADGNHTEVEIDPGFVELQAAAAAAAAQPSVLAPRLLALASAACDAITAQIIPSETHKLAYLNAAMIVRVNGGGAPTQDPDKTEFAAFATAVGMQPATLATAAQMVSVASLQLAAALSTLRGAAEVAKSTADLSAALAGFEAAIGALVAALNEAGLTIQVKAPDAILLSGLGA